MYTIFENVIKRGTYELKGLLAKIDSYHVEGKLTDSERDELYSLARERANPENGIDIMTKLNDLETKYRELESRINALNASQSGSTGNPTGEEIIEEYKLGKWYYNGDKITFENKTYICTAPTGKVCVWSPTAYPTYWEEYNEVS